MCFNSKWQSRFNINFTGFNSITRNYCNSKRIKQFWGWELPWNAHVINRSRALISFQTFSDRKVSKLLAKQFTWKENFRFFHLRFWIKHKLFHLKRNNISSFLTGTISAKWSSLRFKKCTHSRLPRAYDFINWRQTSRTLIFGKKGKLINEVVW